MSDRQLLLDSETEPDTRIPVTILTGFLGAGKTTLLNRLLTESHGHRIAVIVNEIGDVGIDGDLIIETEEEVYELTNGCICCNVRGDLIRSLSRLARRRGGFDRILVETTGLAMVGPIAQTFLADDEVSSQFVLDGVITIVDAHNFDSVMLSADENIREVGIDQVVFADRIILNKTEDVDQSTLTRTDEELHTLNPLAEVRRTSRSNVELEWLINVERTRMRDVTAPHDEHRAHDLNGISTVAIEDSTPLDFLAMNYWLSTVITELGPSIYRAKGVLNVANDPHRQVFHSVFQLFEGWPDRLWRDDEVRMTRLVFIGKDLDEQLLRQGFEKCRA